MNRPAADKQLLVEPRPGDLTNFGGVVVTELGLVPVEWKREAGTFIIAFTVPPGATATLRVPSPGARAQLRLNGNNSDGKSAGRYFEMKVPAGKHEAVVSDR